MWRARRRRIFIVTLALTAALVIGLSGQLGQPRSNPVLDVQGVSVSSLPLAIDVLQELEVKGRAPSTGYSRAWFGDGWSGTASCDTRNQILNRDLIDVEVSPGGGCIVLSGSLNDPYTGKSIKFSRGSSTSEAVQIDHVVALSDAWQKGAQNQTPARREAFANDPLNLLAVDGPTNVKKGNADAATWLPPNKAYRCRYIARQIAVKNKYDLWVTKAERDAMNRVLRSCPDQKVPLEYDTAVREEARLLLTKALPSGWRANAGHI